MWVQDSTASNKVVFNAGNVGIGTTNPTELLSLQSTDAANIVMFTINNLEQSGLRLYRARAGSTAVIAGDRIGVINSLAFDGTSYINAASIGFDVDGTPGAGNMPSRISFKTTPDGSATRVERMRIDNQGNVGIGTTNPSSKLYVNNGSLIVSKNGTTWSSNAALLAAANSGKYVSLAADGGYAMWVQDSTASNKIVFNAGNVGIGTTNPTEKLLVVGNIRVSNGSFIDDGTTLNAPDYVFEEDYGLMSLNQLQAYIESEKHLPNIPSAADIKENGLNVSQFQMKLLEKIEELTLHTLAQQEQIEAQQSKIESLDARLNAGQ